MSKKGQRFNNHHRLARSNGGTDTFPHGNLVRVNKLKHAYFHGLFGVKDILEIADELNEFWIDPRYELVVRRRGEQYKIPFP